MVEKIEDARITRTRKAIQVAFTELIKECDYEQITVKDITSRAKINRGTFYAHYQDKVELMYLFQEKLLVDLVTMVKVNLSKNIMEYKEDVKLETSIITGVSIFEYLNEHNRLFQMALKSNGNTAFQKALKHTIWSILSENTSKPLINKDKLLVPADYLTSYISSAHLGVIQQWFENGRVESPKEMAQIITTITVSGPYYAAGFKN